VCNQGLESSLQSKIVAAGICFSVLLINSSYIKHIVGTVLLLLLLSQAGQMYEGRKSFHKHGKIVLCVI
jgi:hypothetical protein